MQVGPLVLVPARQTHSLRHLHHADVYLVDGRLTYIPSNQVQQDIGFVVTNQINPSFIHAGEPTRIAHLLAVLGKAN